MRAVFRLGGKAVVDTSCTHHYHPHQDPEEGFAIFHLPLSLTQEQVRQGFAILVELRWGEAEVSGVAGPTSIVPIHSGVT